MFNVSILLLDDTLSTCVVTEVVFSLLLLRHWHFRRYFSDALEV